MRLASRDQCQVKERPLRCRHRLIATGLLVVVLGCHRAAQQDGEIAPQLPDDPKPGQLWTNPVDGAVMVYVPAGEFVMGRADGTDSERPQRTVYVDAYWIDRTDKMLDGCMADCSKLQPEQTIHVPFDDFMADDMGTIERIYAMEDHPLTTEVRQAMARYIEDNPRGKHGQIAYDLEADFGIDREDLYRQLAPYMERFGVRRELPKLG